MTARTAFVAAVLVCLAATCSAQTVDVSGFRGTALAPFANALGANAALARDMIANAPLVGEAATDPPTAARSAEVNSVLNNPTLLSAMTTATTVNGLEASVPPAVAIALIDLETAPTSGNLAADLTAFQRDLEGNVPGLPSAAGSRKLLRVKV